MIKIKREMQKTNKEVEKEINDVFNLKSDKKKNKYKRITDKNWKEHYDIFEECFDCEKDCNQCKKNFKALVSFAEIEDKLENNQLCDLEEVRKETAKEILVLLGKGFDEITRKDFKDLSWYKQFCRELKIKYGVDLEDEE